MLRLWQQQPNMGELHVRCFPVHWLLSCPPVTWCAFDLHQIHKPWHQLVMATTQGHAGRRQLQCCKYRQIFVWNDSGDYYWIVLTCWSCAASGLKVIEFGVMCVFLCNFEHAQLSASTCTVLNLANCVCCTAHFLQWAWVYYEWFPAEVQQSGSKNVPRQTAEPCPTCDAASWH